MYNPPSPNKILKEDWFEPLGMTVVEFALKIGTSRKNMTEILNGRTRISPEMSLKLSKALNTSPAFFLNLQAQYDIWEASKRVDLSKTESIAL